MDTTKFNDILASIATMTDQQKLELFHTVCENSKSTIYVGVYESRDGIDMNNEDKPPLTDAEWEKFVEHADSQIEHTWGDAYYESLCKARSDGGNETSEED